MITCYELMQGPVQVYSEERIEIVWKMNDWFFTGTARKKEVTALQ